MIEKTRNSLGVLTVATNIYLDYWMEMALTADARLATSFDLTLHVFTDRGADARSFANQLKRATVKVHEIPTYRWPDATLRRYEIFEQFAPLLSEDFLIHLDADMLVIRECLNDLPELVGPQGIAVVQHPGYFRPKNLSRLAFYALNPSKIFPDIAMRLRVGNLGTWETDLNSTASVPRQLRQDYICGGTWMGRRNELLELIIELAQRVRIDMQHGQMAIWHDESHMNAAHAVRRFRVLSPAFCYAQNYPQLKGITALIEAVDKKIMTRD